MSASAEQCWFDAPNIVFAGDRVEFTIYSRDAFGALLSTGGCDFRLQVLAIPLPKITPRSQAGRQADTHIHEQVRDAVGDGSVRQAGDVEDCDNGLYRARFEVQ